MIDRNFILLREQVIRLIREFFYSQNFHEVIIPVLNTTVPLEPHIHPFTTTWKTTQSNRTLYLSTSPERRLKIMLAHNLNNCFAIASSFRNLENAGTLHTPEFLMLEWYRKDSTYTDIMTDTQNLITYIADKLHYSKKSIFQISTKWSTVSLASLFSNFLHVNLETLIQNDTTLFDLAKKKGCSIDTATWNELFDQLFVNEVEPHLSPEPFFLIDFPSRVSPLCKPKKNNPLFAERFELYINSIEVANGNTENTDAQSVKKQFAHEQRKRKASQPIDTHFINALTTMNTSCYAGIGLGVDRLSMLLHGSSTIEMLGSLI